MSTDCLLSVGLKCLTCVTSFYPPSNMMKQVLLAASVSQVWRLNIGLVELLPKGIISSVEDLRGASQLSDFMF